MLSAFGTICSTSQCSGVKRGVASLPGRRSRKSRVVESTTRTCAPRELATCMMARARILFFRRRGNSHAHASTEDQRTSTPHGSDRAFSDSRSPSMLTNSTGNLKRVRSVLAVWNPWLAKMPPAKPAQSVIPTRNGRSGTGSHWGTLRPISPVWYKDHKTNGVESAEVFLANVLDLDAVVSRQLLGVLPQ